MVKQHICKAEELAGQQLDEAQHRGRYFDSDNCAKIRYKGVDVLDPWIKEECQNEPWSWEMHKASNVGVDPFIYYGKKRTATIIG